jgi:hypothetical protein
VSLLKTSFFGGVLFVCGWLFILLDRSVSRGMFPRGVIPFTLAIADWYITAFALKALVKQFALAFAEASHEPTDGGPGPIPPGQSSPDARRRQ